MKIKTTDIDTTGTAGSSTFLRGDGQWEVPPGTATGTVTSVGVSVPTGFQVSNSPVTSSGAITISYDTGYQGYTSAEALKVAALGTMSTQNANGVAITGGSITGLSAFSVGSDVGLLGAQFRAGNTADEGSYSQGFKGGNPSYLIGDYSSAYGGTTAGFVIYSYTGPVVFHAAGIRPDNDGSTPLGEPSYRFSTLYASTGTINTSDERAKRDIEQIPDAWLDAWGEVEWSRFRFKDGDRWHVGLVAQRVRDAFARHGIDACEIGLLCYDQWDRAPPVRQRRDKQGAIVREARPARPAGDRWGLRYDECFALEAAYVRRQLSRAGLLG